MEEVRFVKKGFCQVIDADDLDDELIDIEDTYNLTQAMEDLYIQEQDGSSNQVVEDTVDMNSQIKIKGHDLSSSISSVSSNEDTNIIVDTIVPAYRDGSLCCVLNEPWVRIAGLYFFEKNDYFIFGNHMKRLLSNELLSNAAKGSVMDFYIMSVLQTWKSQSMFDIFEQAKLLCDVTLPSWFTRSLEILPFYEIHDQSNVTANEDNVIDFLNMDLPTYALLPSQFAGPDGIVATNTPGIYVFFSSALSLSGEISYSKYIKNLKTTNADMFYTKSYGELYSLSKLNNNSLRMRYNKVHELINTKRIQGAICLNFQFPKVEKEIPKIFTQDRSNRTDLIINLDLSSASSLFSPDMIEFLKVLCFQKRQH